MNEVGTFGVMAYLIATRTMPIGFPIKAFADDADSIAVHEIEAGGAKIDMNGKLIAWTVANPITVSIGVVPGSTEDDLLSVIYNANRVSKAVKLANDSINMVVRWPNGGIRTFTDGIIQSGPASPTGTADGRMAGNVYTFAFGDQFSLTIASALNAIASRFDVAGTISSAIDGIGIGGGVAS